MICRPTSHQLIAFFHIVLLGLSLASSEIQPAWESSSARSTSGTNLFDYETLQLTNAVLERLRSEEELAAITPKLSFGPAPNEAPRNSAAKCKLLPGDDEWPSEKAWKALNNSLGGSLISTIPLASPCYTNWANQDQARCADITTRWTTSSLHINDPASVLQPIFQGRTCMPTAIAPDNCTLGGFPSYVVNISNVAQIQLAVNYARNANLRLVVKNTGHDGYGKSIGKGALSVWTHHLKDVKFVEEIKINGYVGPAMKIGAGVQLIEVYEAAHRFGVTALGGICKSIGYAGGYLLGGGHGPLGSLYGMAADQILAFEVVTASGNFITVTESRNGDLFSALKGGGGGTFAIVTSVVIRVYPKLPGTVANFKLSLSGNVTEKLFFQGLRAYWDNFIRFTEAGTWSHFWLRNASGVVSFDVTPFYAPKHTIEEFNALLNPWFEELRRLGIPLTINTTYSEDFLTGFGPALVDFGASTVRAGLRIFPRKNWENTKKLDETFEAMMSEIRAGRVSYGDTMAPKLRVSSPNSVAPFWRTAIATMIGAIALPASATPSELREGSRILTEEILGKWRAVAPNSEGGGVYLNEGDINEPDWQEAMYSSAVYRTLKRVKNKWDPEGVFYAVRGSGSDDWEVRDGDQGIQTQDGRLCKRA